MGFDLWTMLGVSRAAGLAGAGAGFGVAILLALTMALRRTGGRSSRASLGLDQDR
jgi:hypothetical protein